MAYVHSNRPGRGSRPAQSKPNRADELVDTDAGRLHDTESIFMSAQEELFQLQLEQLRHDERYHRDIWVLSLDRRLIHMAMHFAKYTGWLARIVRDGDHESLKQTITDAFIIGLSSANMLNIDVRSQITECNQRTARTLSDLGKEICENSNTDFSDLPLLLVTMAIETGSMAKSCESLDHVEAHASRAGASEAVVALIRIALAAAHANEIDLSISCKHRLQEVEKKLLFHGYL